MPPCSLGGWYEVQCDLVLASDYLTIYSVQLVAALQFPGSQDPRTLELETNLREVLQSQATSLLKVASTAFTFKNLLRHYNI